MSKNILSEKEYIELIESLSKVLKDANLNGMQKTDVLAIMLLGHLAVISAEHGIKVAEILATVPGLLGSREDTTKKIEDKEEGTAAKINFRSLKRLGVIKDHWGLDPELLKNNH